MRIRFSGQFRRQFEPKPRVDTKPADSEPAGHRIDRDDLPEPPSVVYKRSLKRLLEQNFAVQERTSMKRRAL